MASQPYTKLEEEKNILEKDTNLLKVETQSSETIQTQEIVAQSNETDCDIIVCSTPLAHHTIDGRETQESEKHNDNADITSIDRRDHTSLSICGHIRQNWILFVVKPVMIFYGLQYAVMMSATTQLWIERSCHVDFNYTEDICNNLNDPKWREAQNAVQAKVTEYNIIGSYLTGVPPIFIGLYIGPVSDRGRKLLMYIPFLAHTISGLVPFFVLYFNTCSPKYLWFNNLYVIGGGYSVLSIAMYGYIGDVTNQRNRTTVMSILAGLGLIIFPLGIALGGQIYAWAGYYAVYACSFAFNILGLIYIYFVPESITTRNVESVEEETESPEENTWCHIFGSVLYRGNKSVLDSWRCLWKERPNGMRNYLHSILVVSMSAGMAASWNSGNNGFLFTERMFGWELVDYTNFASFAFVIIALRTFVTTPILCYVFGMHDCMLAIVGGLASITTYVVTALATKGWMMYYSVSLSIIGGLTSTPLQSMLSKCVEKDEYGKIFTLSSVAISIASLVSTTFLQKLYEFTVQTFPGAMYVALSAMESITVLLLSILFIFIIRHERKFGAMGKDADEIKTQ